ncbi:ribonuclease H-like domain-containing protein [Clostridium tyrobutyricum]|uniref:ribonuclease H-like domain-containing protein n=1 Tax=Clostridium tyrobutyricum TaxID=1519 RepID=UPI00057ED035|nr:ribonuclease H-like domain-containing protein [Clostridium tyrobutyricum]
MFAKKYDTVLNIPEKVFNTYNMKNVAYFDIETTGFDKNKDNIILISFGNFIDYNKFSIKQYFAENLEDEGEVLYSFGSDVLKYENWCSYNGIAFDEPFICERMIKENIFFEPPKKHIDLYRLIRPYYKQLGMERCNLKTVEKYIGVQRKDHIDGGISVDLYKQFLSTNDEKLEDTIMLHNYEDVLNLPKIHEFIYKIQNNDSLVRSDIITHKQLKFLTSLLTRNNIQLDFEINKMSKKSASRTIDYILKGGKDPEKITDISNNSY